MQNNSNNLPSKEEQAKILEEMKKDSAEKTKKYYKELVKIFTEKGSVELLAQVILLEIRAQNPAYHDPTNTLSENPIGLFLSGLFLNYNNLRAIPVEPFLAHKIIDLASNFFDSFRKGLALKELENKSKKKFVAFYKYTRKIFF